MLRQSGPLKLTIGCINRKHDSWQHNVVLEMFQEYSSKPNVAIVGKFNAANINRRILTSFSQSHFQISLCGTILHIGLIQDVKERTWIFSKQRVSRIDLVFSNYQNEISDNEYSEPIRKVDYWSISFCFKHTTELFTTEMRRDMFPHLFALSETWSSNSNPPISFC